VGKGTCVGPVGPVGPGHFLVRVGPEREGHLDIYVKAAKKDKDADNAKDADNVKDADNAKDVNDDNDKNAKRVKIE
jgi:hypothetical protein